MRRCWSSLSAAALLSAFPLLAQLVPIGAEFVVNSYTSGGETDAEVAPLFGGGFVVIWHGGDPTDGSAIFGRRFDASAAPLGLDFRVNTVTTDSQYTAAVAGGDETGFVVVWGGSDKEISGQRYANSGTPLGGQFHINTYTTGNQVRPSVGMTPAAGSGAFIVAWESSEDGSGTSVVCQRYFSSGAPWGPPFRVNTYTLSNQAYPSVAVDQYPRFVIAWGGREPGDSPLGIAARRFDIVSDVASDFPVNTYTTHNQNQPMVVWTGADSFVVVWTTGAETNDRDVRARSFNFNTGPTGPELQVNSFTTGYQWSPSVAAISEGNFVVVWESGYGPQQGIYAQRASASSLKGPEFRIDGTSGSTKRRPSIANIGGSRFVVAWQASDGVAYGGYNIHARRLCVGRGDADADGAISVTDVFYLINNVFAAGPAPLLSCDVNNDTHTDVNDVFFLINYLFAGGAPPACA